MRESSVYCRVTGSRTASRDDNPSNYALNPCVRTFACVEFGVEYSYMYPSKSSIIDAVHIYIHEGCMHDMRLPTVGILIVIQ